MKPFPILIEQEVVIVCSEASTGIVLNRDFSYALNDEQEVFTICKSFEDALSLANLIMKERENVECVIQGRNQEVLKYLNPNQKS